MNHSFNTSSTPSDHGSQAAAFARSHYMGNHSNFLRDNRGAFGMNSPNIEDFKNLVSRSFDQGSVHRGGPPHHDYNK